MFYFREKTHSSNRYRDIFYYKGRPHGFYRKFLIDNTFEEIGCYLYGNLFGEFIRKCEGNGYLIGRHSKLTTSNEIEDLVGCCTYIYPDLKSCIFGSFKFQKKIKKKNISEVNTDLKLESGKYGKITDIIWTNGFPMPTSSRASETVFSYDPSTWLRIRYKEIASFLIAFF